MAILRALSTVLFIVAIPVALITLNVRYAFNEERLWSYGFDRYDADLRTGLPRTEIDRAATELREYFNSDQAAVRIQVVQDGREVALFTPREVTHLADVKSLLRGVYFIQAMTLAYVLAYVVAVFVWAREMPVRSLARRMLTGGLATVVLLVGFGIAASLGFERLFTEFHVISFSNDFWQLDPATDHLVQMFPLPFWQDATFFVAALTIGEALLAVGLSSLYLRRTSRRQPASTGEEYSAEPLAFEAPDNA